MSFFRFLRDETMSCLLRFVTAMRHILPFTQNTIPRDMPHRAQDTIRGGWSPLPGETIPKGLDYSTVSGNCVRTVFCMNKPGRHATRQPMPLTEPYLLMRRQVRRPWIEMTK